MSARVGREGKSNREAWTPRGRVTYISPLLFLYPVLPSLLFFYFILLSPRCHPVTQLVCRWLLVGWRWLDDPSFFQGTRNCIDKSWSHESLGKMGKETDETFGRFQRMKFHGGRDYDVYNGWPCLPSDLIFG